ALRGGVPDTVGAMAVSRVCGSGLQAVMLAAQAIRAGDAQVMVAGGMESMSNAPYYLFGHRSGDRKSTRLNSSHVKISYAVFCLAGDPSIGTRLPYTTLFRSSAEGWRAGHRRRDGREPRVRLRPAGGHAGGPGDPGR